jgi:hypothetical protein
MVGHSLRLLVAILLHATAAAAWTTSGVLDDAAPTLTELAGQWIGVTSRNISFRWTIQESGDYELVFREAGKEFRRRGRVWIDQDGVIQWRSETGRSGTLARRTKQSGERALQGTINASDETLEMSVTGPATSAGRDDYQPVSAVIGTDKLRLIECTRYSFRSVSVEAGSAVDLATDSTAKEILAKAATFAQRACPKNERFGDIVVLITQSGSPHEKSCGIGGSCVVRARNYSRDRTDWQEYSNHALNAKVAAEEEQKARDQRQREQERERREAEARRNVEERYRAHQREQQELLKREADAKRAAILARVDEFARRYGVQQWVNENQLVTNPFVFKGKVIGIRLHFEEMTAETEGLFSGGFVVGNIPTGMFRVRGPAIMAVRVLGKTDISVPLLGRMLVTKLGFVGAHVCRDSNCRDFLGEQ